MTFNYTYYGRPISKSQFEKNVASDWQENLDQYDEYSDGGYNATLID